MNKLTGQNSKNTEQSLCPRCGVVTQVSLVKLSQGNAINVLS